MMRFLLPAFLLVAIPVCAQQNFWQLKPGGGIQWNVKPQQVHSDHIEMSGKQISAIVSYGLNAGGRMELSRKLVFPMLRTIPNDTRGNLICEFKNNIVDSITLANKLISELPQSFSIRGFLQSVSNISSEVSMERTVFPSTDKAAYIESYTIRNHSKSSFPVHIPETDSSGITDENKGVYGAYVVNYKVYNGGDHLLNANGILHFYLVISARKKADPPYYFSDVFEWQKRLELVNELQGKLVLQTPNDTINRMFAFAKTRAAESIYDTREGLMHGPGGGEYYAAFWANDQAEYINPFFAYLGNAAGLESARNSYRLFAKYMNPEFRPIPSSIVAEGADFWNGAGDRGDQAMIGFGASQFALTCGDTLEANVLWPLVEWCNQYLLRRKTGQGVIVSESDELEGRFPAGKINLSTNVLTYGSLVYGARLAASLGKTNQATEWQKESRQLHENIERYFGGNVEGFDTYRYYDGNDKLRSWICLPLVLGIYERSKQTQAALLSPKLWTKNGLLTESGSTTFWDRSLLYAFRGLLKAGATDTAMRYLSYYSAQRLLGEHVPYAIEAWPEGNQRHLSAESGLYCRALVEGLFGFDAVGFKEFSICPRLPANWNQMSLNEIFAFDTRFSIRVKRTGKKYLLTIQEAGRQEKSISWDGQKPVSFKL